MVLNNENCHGILWTCVSGLYLVHYKCVVTEFQWGEISSLAVEKKDI